MGSQWDPILLELEAEYFTGDASKDIYSPGPTIAKTSL